MLHAKTWCSADHAQKRVQWAKSALRKRPDPEDWYNIRFSDECHYGYGPQGRTYVIRKPGERYCPDCIQRPGPEPENDDEKRGKHTWAAVGWNFKSPLIFYDVPGNDNGAITMKVYRDEILEPVVKPWLDDVKKGRCEPFVLEEDGAPGHGNSGKGGNIVKTWKEKNNLVTYVNCPASADIAPIENTWQAPKAWMRTVPHYSDESMIDLIVEGWDYHLSQGFINERVHSMPKRLEEVIEAEGQMTGN